jgi:8-oxo-dGTP pyrophosphatase MutT (NUDIX family)
MYVTDDLIREMERQFGVPAFRKFQIPSTLQEVERIRSSQRDGRNHDATLYVRKGSQLIVISKHPYPPGLFRAPSGGLHPGEDFLTGINREIAEEIGCEIELKKFLLRTTVDFNADDGSGQTVFWRSFVFLADYVRGDFNFTGHHEIFEVRLADWSEFDTFGKIMRQLGWGGLIYRAQLHEAVVDLLANQAPA